MEMNLERARELAAQAWCEESTGHIIMQPELAEAFAMILARETGMLPGGFEPLDSQIQRLANFIMAEIPGEPSQNEGAIDTAIRLLRLHNSKPQTVAP